MTAQPVGEPTVSRETSRSDGRHDCPKNGCARRVSAQFLACRAHWMQVSAPTRARVYDTFRGGIATSEYLEARSDAIHEMNARPPARS